MRANEFIKEEEKLDEVLPLITGAASLAGGAMRMAGGVASGIGAAARGIGKGVGAAAKGIGKGVGAVSTRVGQSMGPATPDEKSTDPASRAAADRAKDQLIKPGSQVKLPTPGPGGNQPFKVTRVQGNEVEIENPDAKDPTQPNKLVYNKADLKKSMSI
jgi:hypothetical protein